MTAIFFLNLAKATKNHLSIKIAVQHLQKQKINKILSIADFALPEFLHEVCAVIETPLFPSAVENLYPSPRRDDPNTDLFFLGKKSLCELVTEENLDIMQKEITQWWQKNAHLFIEGTLIVGTELHFSMLSYLGQNKPRFNGQYRHFQLPPYAVVEYGKHIPEQDLWPSQASTPIRTESGTIQVSRFASSHVKLGAKAIIIPGYSNSRFGAYGIYTRLARLLAFYGIESYTLDYLGTGESTPSQRTFSSDIYSVETLLNKIASIDEKVFIISHSYAAALLANICKNWTNVFGIAISPIFSMHQMESYLFLPEQTNEIIANGDTMRRGMRFSAQYVQTSESEWDEGAHALSSIIYAEKDKYDPDREYKEKAVDVPVYDVDGANHNFSLGKSSFKLLETVLQIVFEEIGNGYIKA